MYLHRAVRAKMTEEEVEKNTLSAIRIRKKIIEAYGDLDKSIKYLSGLIIKVTAGRDTLLTTDHIEEIISYLDQVYGSNFVNAKKEQPSASWSDILKTSANDN